MYVACCNIYFEDILRIIVYSTVREFVLFRGVSDDCVTFEPTCYFMIIYTVIQPRLISNEYHIFSNPVSECVVFNKLTLIHV